MGFMILGTQIAFQRVPRKLNAVLSGHAQVNTHSGVLPIATTTAVVPSGSDQKSKKNWRDLPTFDLSNPARLTSFAPLDPQPFSSTTLDVGAVATSLTRIEGGEWDPWANGPFCLDLTHDEFIQSKQLGVH